jgi:hypothetical protein
MEQFLRSYKPWEKTVSERGSIKQLMYTKDDLKRKNQDGTRNTDNIKSFAGKTMVVGGAVGLVVKWCQRLFGWWKKEKKKKKWWFWRAMDGVWNFLMIWWGATVGHRLITGERRWGTDGEVDSGTPGSLPTQKEAEDFTKEFTAEEQAAYNGTAAAINDMYSTNAGLDPAGSSVDTDMFGESVFEHTADGDNTMGLIVSMIDKRHGTVETITSTGTVFKELFGKSIHEGLDRARDYAKDAIVTLFWFAAGMISNSLATKVLWVQSKEELNKILAENPQIADKYDEALRKYLKVIAYFDYNKEKLPWAIARQHLLSTDPAFAQLDEDDQVDKIDKLLDDPEFVKNTIDPVMKQYNEAPLLTKEGKTGAIQLLKQYNILDGSLIPADQKKLEAITQDQNEMIHKDDDGDVFTSMQESLQTGNQAQAKEQLSTLHTDLQAHAENSWRASRRSAYIPLLSMFDTDEQTKKRLFTKCWFDEIAQVHIKKLQELTSKETLTDTDISAAKQTVNDYFAAVKELEITNLGVVNIFEEDGEFIIDIWHTILQTGESLVHAVRLIINKKDAPEWFSPRVRNPIEGVGMLMGTGISLAVVTYPIRAVARLSSFRAPGKVPLVGKARKIGTWIIRKTAQLWPRNSLIRSRWLTSKYHSNAWLLKADLATGRISLDEALRLAKRIWSGDFLLNSNKLRSVDDLLRRWFWLTDQAHIDVLKNNRDAPRRKTIMNKEFAGKRYTPRQRLQKARRDNWFDTTKLQTYINVNNRIGMKPAGIQQEFFKTLLAHSKDEKLITQLLKEQFPSKLLHLLIKQKNRSSADCKTPRQARMISSVACKKNTSRITYRNHRTWTS